MVEVLGVVVPVVRCSLFVDRSWAEIRIDLGCRSCPVSRIVLDCRSCLAGHMNLADCGRLDSDLGFDLDLGE